MRYFNVEIKITELQSDEERKAHGKKETERTILEEKFGMRVSERTQEGRCCSECGKMKDPEETFVAEICETDSSLRHRNISTTIDSAISGVIKSEISLGLIHSYIRY